MRALVFLAALTLSPAIAAAQAANPAPAPPAAPSSGDTYTYQAQGRRDPFVGLLNTGQDPRPIGVRRVDGPGGLLTGEISVRGVMQSRDRLVAMIQGPDKKTWVIHAGDKLMDGVIRNVTPQGLVIVQDVNDPLSLVKQREVHKMLRSLEDAKE
jgi:Tfp pilus assembly protein PilP